MIDQDDDDAEADEDDDDDDDEYASATFASKILSALSLRKPALTSRRFGLRADEQ